MTVYFEFPSGLNGTVTMGALSDYFLQLQDEFVRMSTRCQLNTDMDLKKAGKSALRHPLGPPAHRSVPPATRLPPGPTFPGRLLAARLSPGGGTGAV